MSVGVSVCKGRAEESISKTICIKNEESRPAKLFMESLHLLIVLPCVRACVKGRIGGEGGGGWGGRGTRLILLTVSVKEDAVICI
jgi:hypothetical protein